MATLATDTFTGSNGAAWNAQWTTSAGNGGTANFTIQNNAGQWTVNASGAYPQAFLSGMSAATDCDFYCDFKVSSVATNYMFFAVSVPSATYASADSFFPDTGYGVQVTFDSSSGAATLQLIRCESGSYTSEVSAGITTAAGTWYTMLVRRRGAVISGFFYPQGGTVPTSPQVTWTDPSPLGSGKVLVTGAPESTAITQAIDNVTVTDGTTGSTGSLALSGSGSLALSGHVSAAQGTLALSGSGSLTFKQVLSNGTGTLALSGSGSLVLSGEARQYGLPAIVSTSARWSWAMGPWSALPTLALANATQRKMKLRLTGTSEVTFDLDGTTAEAAALQELVTDVWCIRNGYTLMRGRLGPTTHTADGDKYTISCTAGDYRALLQRRILFDSDTLSYTSWDTTDIAGDLIKTTQGHDGGNLQITDQHLETGTLRTMTYPAGQAIGEAIEQLSQMDAGYNWDIVPTTGQVGQSFTTWASRGEARQRVVDYPGQIAKFTRTVDPGSYANAIRETGDTGIAAVALAASDITTRPEGRWDVQLGDTSLKDASSVQSRANFDLASRQEIVPAYTVTLQPGAWGGPTDIGLGDSVLLVIDAGPLQVAENLRVFEIDIDLDDADNETVTLTLSALDPFKRRRARQVDLRLTALERR